jgi:O-antigen/teichoic acid export membrane protein
LIFIIKNIKKSINLSKAFSSKTFKDTLFQLFIVVLSRGFSLYNSIFAVKTLGPINYGYSTILQTTVVQTSILYDCNLNNIGIREISQTNNLDIAYKIISFRFILSMMITILWILALIILSPVNYLFWMLGIAGIIINANDLNFIFRALDKYNIYILISAITPLLVTILYLIFLEKNAQIGIDYIIFILASLIPFILLRVYCVKVLKIKLLKIYPIKDYLSLIFESKELWFASIIGIVYPAIQVYLIAFLLGVAENGIYRASFILITPFDLIITTFTGVIMPIVSKWKLLDKRDYIKNINKSVLAISIFFLPFILILLLTPASTYDFFLGNKFLFSHLVFKIILIGKYFYLTFSIFQFATIANKSDTFYLKSNIYIFLLSIILNFLLIPLFGIVGAAISIMSTDIIFPLLLAFNFYKHNNFSENEYSKI